MGKLYDIVQARIDATGVTEATLARRMGSSPQTVNSWKTRGVRRLPEKWLLVALARETGTPYLDVLDAALHDIAYLPEETPDDRHATPKTRAGVSPVAEKRVTERRARSARLEPPTGSTTRSDDEPRRRGRP